MTVTAHLNNIVAVIVIQKMSPKHNELLRGRPIATIDSCSDQSDKQMGGALDLCTIAVLLLLFAERVCVVCTEYN